MTLPAIEKRSDGVPVLTTWNGFRFTFFIPSRRRAHILADHPLLALATVIVNQEEHDTYMAAFRKAETAPAALLTHDTQGLGRIRNICLEYAHPSEEEFQLQCDDDVLGLCYTFQRMQRKIHTSPEYIMNVVAHTAQCAHDLDAGLFGWLYAKNLTYRRSTEPFGVRTMMRLDFGGIRCLDARFDEKLVAIEDMDFLLTCLALKRLVWQDRRYATRCVGGEGRVTTGGDAGNVTQDILRREQHYLVRKWGRHHFTLSSAGSVSPVYSIAVHIPR